MERPTPELNLSMDVKEKQREYTRHFTSTSYGKQELAFRGHNESVESDNIGNCIEYLSSLSEFDHLLANHLESSTVFRGTSLAIQNDLIFAISGVMIKNIKPFVAIVVDETSYCSNQSQLSTVLRYVDSTANVQELFIGFTNVSSDKTAAACFSIYARVFAHTDVLYNILQTKSLDIAYYLQEVSKLKKYTISEFRRSGFPSIWSNMENENSLANTMEPPLKRRKGDELKYRQLYYSILDRMHMEITDRFSDYGKLQFTHLLDSQKFSAYRENFLNEALNKLFQSFNSHFDQVRLKNELSVIYSAEVFDFSNKPIHEILSAIYENQLNQVIPEVLKLATLIVTIPATSASVERTFSALKRIKSYCRSTHTQERLSGLALISIENINGTSTNSSPVKRKLQGRRITTVPVSDYESDEIELDTDCDVSGVLSIFTDSESDVEKKTKSVKIMLRHIVICHCENQDNDHVKDHDLDHNKDHDVDHNKDHDENRDKDHDIDHDENHDKDHDIDHDKHYDKDHDKNHDKDHDKEYDKDHGHDKDYDHDKTPR
ncbi:hypothetical protein ANN_09982 [Periplaneta americana]|uniref:Zinc finger MYM-type protein 1-like n=1 Tax=Periplaneta americana TaxID=6978 RepID=A0ABQ8TN47_PERAM|nr:hypothetical protein ANN_09982 [Periplaneta americana]